MYYQNKVESLKDIFGKEVVLEGGFLKVENTRYPIIDDVIILSQEKQYSDFVRKKLKIKENILKDEENKAFAKDIQWTFSEEWKKYSEILPEHKREFLEYFDIVSLDDLHNLRICDLGCGNGRWSYFLKDACKEIVLVDFSDSIFVARKNLQDVNNCLFFMADLKSLPFRDNFCNFLFCLGVLHHLPTSCLDEVCNLKKFSPTLLIYLYYSLDNRPIYFRLILKMVTLLRIYLCKIRSLIVREIFSQFGTFFFYIPLIFLGGLLRPMGLSHYVPLYETYHGKSIKRIKQDVYDRFFTSIEQRVSKKEILELQDTFTSIIISKNKPYWHFLCKR